MSPTRLIATIPVHDEDTLAESVVHVQFPDMDAYQGFLDGLTAEGFDVSMVVLAEVPSTWACSGLDGCTVAA